MPKVATYMLHHDYHCRSESGVFETRFGQYPAKIVITDPNAIFKFVTHVCRRPDSEFAELYRIAGVPAPQVHPSLI